MGTEEIQLTTEDERILDKVMDKIASGEIKAKRLTADELRAAAEKEEKLERGVDK